MAEVFKKAKLYDYNGDLNKQWYVYYSYRHPESNDLKRFKQIISTKLKTKTSRYAKAKEFVDYYNAKLTAGWNPFSEEDKGLVNIKDALNYILSAKASSLERIRSIHTYRNAVKVFFTFLDHKKLDKISITQFNSTHASQFMDWVVLEKVVTARTHNNYLRQIKTFFNDLIQRNYIIINPFAKVKTLETSEADLICFNRDELMIVQSKLPEYNFELYVIAQLIFYCFLRPAEIMRLRIEDFNLSKQEITVKGSVSKNKKRDIVVVPNHLIPLLLKLKFDVPKEWYCFTRHLLPGTKQAAPTRIAEAWRKFADLYEITKNLYHFKHTGVGMAIENGINVRDLQLQLRHHSLEETQVYLEKFSNKAGDSFKTQRAAF